MLDIEPEITGRNPGSTDAVGVTNAQYYDVLGRRYFLAVQLDF